MNKLIQILTMNSVSLSNNSDSSRRQLWLEVLGFFIAGLGIFMILCLVSFDGKDIQSLSLGNPLRNWGGPAGAYLASGLLITLGYVSFAIPTGLILWGAWFAIGKVQQPNRKLMLAFLIGIFILAGFSTVFLYQPETPVAPGGAIGKFIGLGLMQLFGFAGAVVFLTFASVATLIMTRTVTFRDPNAEVITGTKFKPGPKAVIEEAEEEETPKKRSKKAKDNDEVEIDLANPPAPGFQVDLDPATKAPAKPAPTLFKSTPLSKAKSAKEDPMMAELTEKLGEFKVNGEVIKVTEGPVVKTYEYEPAAGTKVAKIESLQNDLARLLAAESLRVVPVPGSTTVGFEIPNKNRQVINFGNLISHSKFKSKDMALPIAMGTDCFGQPVVEDLAEMPHLLVAGSTGSGKSVFINTLIASLLVRNTAKDLRLVLIDPKMVELGSFNNTAHMGCPVVTDVAQDGLPLLERLVYEMEERYKKLKVVGAKNLPAYNEIIKTKKKGQFKKFTGKWQPMPYVVVVVDEFADMMMSLGKEAEQHIARLAQKARAAGIHLVIATQRPSVKVVTGLIKANFPTRIGFRVTSAVDSRTILDQSGAETLLGKGDMLYLSTKGLSRLHSSYLSEEEINKLVKACKKK